MSAPPLDQRLRQVLMAIISEYGETAEPGCPRPIWGRHIPGLPPATIRNAMADLEDLGYLTQPHTSAGRVPADRAYRFYVDALGQVPWKATETPAAEPMPTADAAERLMAGTPGLLSDGTHMTGMLLAPPLRRTALDRIDLAALGEDRALAVVVTETGWVTARAITPMPRPGLEELREIGRTLTRRYRGKTFQTILDDIERPRTPRAPTDPLWARCRSLLDQIGALLRDRNLYISGAINVLDHPDFSDVATMRGLLKAFEDKARLVDLLTRMAEERGVQVMIGGENP